MSLLIGVLTALVTMVVAGYVAGLAVGWYRISSFEGGSGYFVVGMAFLGLAGGFIIGMVVSRVVAARANPGFGKALGLALGTSLGIVLAVGTIARLQADVPPMLDGQELLLAVEIRWPDGQTPAESNASSDGRTPGAWSLVLSSSSGRTVRASRSGPLWREDARLEDGRWVVPGAVELFTSRGERILDVQPDGLIENGFIVPLPGRPGQEHLEWSDWLPHARDGEAPLPDGFRYRFRAVPRDQPIRTEAFGPFEIATVASGFNEVTTSGTAKAWAAEATFVIRHQGQPVAIEHGTVGAVAALGGPVPALLVQAGSRDVGAACHVLSTDQGQLRIERVGDCAGPLKAAPLTSDNEAFTRARDSNLPAGRFDRGSFATPGLYLFDDVVLDTRTLTTRAVSADGQSRLIARIPPLGVSHDEASFVRLEFAEDSNEDLALAVTVNGTGERYRLTIDKTRMRYADFDQIDPAWVLHHFAWQRTAGGADRLVERTGVTPLPYRGTLTLDSTGYREYRVAPAKEGLRAALVAFLVAEFRAEPLEAAEGAFAHTVRFGGATVSVSYDASGRHVGIWMDRATDSTLVATIAERFDAALKTGRYDDLFGL